MWISKGFPAGVNDSLQTQIFGLPDQFTEPANGKVKITVRPRAVRTVGAKEGALIQVVDPALPPDKPSFPRKTVIVLGATGVGFIVALFIALLQAGYERMTRNQETAVKVGMLRRALFSKKRRA